MSPLTASWFSLDADAHLRKLAGNTYSAVAHYPVELVRSALRRGASQVQVNTGTNCLEIEDNGPGLDSEELQGLLVAYNRQAPERNREEALAKCQGPGGIGMLALFACNPRRVVVENFHDGSLRSFVFQDGKVSKSNPAGRERGIRLSVYRPRRYRQDEARFLRHFCRAVTQEVLLNGENISGHPLLNRPLVYAALPADDKIAAGMIGIARRGDGCQIWLLDQRIPWSHAQFPAWKGLLFDAALETSTPLDSDLLDKLAQTAQHLYLWLAERYAAYSPSQQERVERLFFRHYEDTGDTALINRLAPFRLYPDRRLNLSHLMAKWQSRPLQAIILPSQIAASRLLPADTLLLTSLQADFLGNRLQLPLRLLPLDSTPRIVKWRLRRYFSFLKSLRQQALFLPRRIPPAGKIRAEEIQFLMALRSQLSAGQNGATNSRENPEPVWVEGRGLRPFARGRTRKGWKIFLFRQHPLMRRAVAALARDPHNIEWLAPLFACAESQKS